jgi:hypothetical protein
VLLLLQHTSHPDTAPPCGRILTNSQRTTQAAAAAAAAAAPSSGLFDVMFTSLSQYGNLALTLKINGLQFNLAKKFNLIFIKTALTSLK